MEKQSPNHPVYVPPGATMIVEGTANVSGSRVSEGATLIVKGNGGSKADVSGSTIGKGAFCVCISGASEEEVNDALFRAFKK